MPFTIFLVLGMMSETWTLSCSSEILSRLALSRTTLAWGGWGEGGAALLLPGGARSPGFLVAFIDTQEGVLLISPGWGWASQLPTSLHSNLPDWDG